MQNFLRRWGTIITIVVLVSLGAYQGNQNEKTTQKLNQVTNGQITESCAAVKLSDNAISQFVHRATALGPNAHNPASLAFIDDLDQSLAAAEAQCLRGGGVPPTLPPPTLPSSPTTSK